MRQHTSTFVVRVTIDTTRSKTLKRVVPCVVTVGTLGTTVEALVSGVQSAVMSAA